MDKNTELKCFFCLSPVRAGTLKCRWCGEFLAANPQVTDDRLREALRHLDAVTKLVREELERRALASKRGGREVVIHVGMTMAKAERLLGMATLEALDGNREEAARVLDISERTIYRKLDEWSSLEEEKEPGAGRQDPEP
jgi:DNA-binding NtrC family response regulator